MTKKQLIEIIAEQAGLSKKDAEKALNAFIKVFGSAMKKGHRIRLTGVGTFIVENRSARIVRNPKTGVKLKVPSKKVIKFKESTREGTDDTGPKRS
jgi:DNA-binding protein HU-beta